MKSTKSSMKIEQQTNRHKLMKSKEKSHHKSQGKQAPTEQIANGGDAFAYGLSNALVEAQNMKGSKQGFLGVETKMLDPSEYIKKDKLHVKKG